MTRHALDDLDRVRFDWPEPLVIDLIGDQYRDVAGFPERMTIARLQANALRALFDDAENPSLDPRLELIVYCAARGIGPAWIARADRAVFWELTKIVAKRFRTSPRARAEVREMLHAALGRLATETPPARRPAAPALARARAH